MTNTTFDGLGLIEPLRLALKAENYLKPTPIQGVRVHSVLSTREVEEVGAYCSDLSLGSHAAVIAFLRFRA